MFALRHCLSVGTTSSFFTIATFLPFPFVLFCNLTGAKKVDTNGSYFAIRFEVERHFYGYKDELEAVKDRIDVEINL
jgi:hypothetical protein